MKVAIIGASGKTGIRLVRESLKRGYEVVAVCRHASKYKLDEFKNQKELTLITAPVVSDEVTLTNALSGCNAVVAILITVRRLKATDLVRSLIKASTVNNLERFIFTAGEVTAIPEKDEIFTLRQRTLDVLGRLISFFTPYSMDDMVKASELIREQSDWKWSIIRAPVLKDKPSTGYQFCRISEVRAAHELSRKDYASCLLDSIDDNKLHQRILTVIPN